MIPDNVAFTKELHKRCVQCASEHLKELARGVSVLSSLNIITVEQAGELSQHIIKSSESARQYRGILSNFCKGCGRAL